MVELAGIEPATSSLGIFNSAVVRKKLMDSKQNGPQTAIQEIEMVAIAGK